MNAWQKELFSFCKESNSFSLPYHQSCSHSYNFCGIDRTATRHISSRELIWLVEASASGIPNQLMIAPFERGDVCATVLCHVVRRFVRRP
jgi:hypothetical protein